MAGRGHPGGLLAPLASPAFAMVWVATIVSNVGTAMQTVGASWSLVQTHASPAVVASLQAAASAPLFIAGLPAGVLADIVDRRRLLIAANLWAAAAAGILAVLAILGAAPPWVLLAATFAIGLGAAFSAPAFQAVVPELAGDAPLAPAVALNAIGTNVARTIGPALGGVAVAALGAPATFAANAISTLAVVAALIAWRRAPQPRRLPPEHFLGAAKGSVRYARHAPGVLRTLIRAAVFFSIASAPWALLPLVAADRLALGPGGYGALLGGLGVGAVAGAIAIGPLRSALGSRIVPSANAVCAAGGLALAAARSEWTALVAIAVFGAGWIVTLTLLNVSVQSAVAGWVRARMLALFVVSYFGSFAIGSVAWGRIADLAGVPATLAAAGVAGLLATPLLARMDGAAIPDGDLAPASGEPDLAPDGDDDDDGGAVLVSTDHEVAAGDATAFAAAMLALRESRLRNGAFSWRHWTDPSDPEFHRESYVVESWTEHLRQGLRRTVADERAEAAVDALSSGKAATRLLREGGRA